MDTQNKDITNNPNLEEDNKLGFKDLSKTFKNAYDVYRGQINKVPALWKDGKQLVSKASEKVGTTPGVLTAGIVAIGAAFVIYRMRTR